MRLRWKRFLNLCVVARILMPETEVLETAAEAIVGNGEPREQLLPLIEMLVDNPERYPATKHVLGFIHCKLAEFNGQTLRLHVWPAGERSYGIPAWPVHTHHWTISSAVIAGYVVNETFSVRTDDHGHKQLYEVHYVGNGLSERRRIDERVSVDVNRSEFWHAGERYSIPLGTYHSTTVPEGTFAATVILTGIRTDVAPLVLGQVSGKTQYRYSVDEVATENWASTLAELRPLMLT